MAVSILHDGHNSVCCITKENFPLGIPCPGCYIVTSQTKVSERERSKPPLVSLLFPSLHRAISCRTPTVSSLLLPLLQSQVPSQRDSRFPSYHHELGTYCAHGLMSGSVERERMSSATPRNQKGGHTTF